MPKDTNKKNFFKKYDYKEYDYLPNFDFSIDENNYTISNYENYILLEETINKLVDIYFPYYSKNIKTKRKKLNYKDKDMNEFISDIFQREELIMYTKTERLVFIADYFDLKLKILFSRLNLNNKMQVIYELDKNYKIIEKYGLKNLLKKKIKV